MSNERHGCTWTKKEDKRLKALFFEHKSFDEMGKALQRTWFACKCRLIRLGLIEGSISKWGESNLEPFRVPCPDPKKSFESLIDFYVKKGFMEMPDVEVEIPDEEDTSRTFSDAELNIVIDYFKTRLAKLAVQKLDTVCFQKGLDIATAEDIFTTEISKINIAKKMCIAQREKELTRIA